MLLKSKKVCRFSEFFISFLLWFSECSLKMSFYHFAEGSRDFDFHLDVSASLVLWLGKVFVVYFPLLLANLFL